MTDETGRKESGSHLFQPGKSGNPSGRPKGARSKLGTAFLEALLSDFSEHGELVIARVRAEKPDQYLKVVASILPKEITGEDGADIGIRLIERRVVHADH